MARTAKEIQEQIDKLEAARRVTRARNGYAHYSERISYLQGELMLQKAKEAQGRDVSRCRKCGEEIAAGSEHVIYTEWHKPCWWNV